MQKMPHLALQLLLAIGIKGDIVPKDHRWVSKKFAVDFALCPTELIISAGYSILNLHFNLRRHEFSIPMLNTLAEQIESLQIHMQRLFWLKQLLLDVLKPCGSRKLHYIEHYPEAILNFGPPTYYDMTRFERAHAEIVKPVFRKTSRRFREIQRAMLDHLKKIHQINRVCKFAENSPKNDENISNSTVNSDDEEQQILLSVFGNKIQRSKRFKGDGLHISYTTTAEIVWEEV